MPLRRSLIAFVLGLVAAPLAAQPAPALAPIVGAPEAAPAPPWRFVGLPKQTLPTTQYTVRELDGQRVLRVAADRSYGNLVHPLESGTPAGLLSWRWRVDQPIAGADLRRKQGDDTALKVCAMFDLPKPSVPFVERQLLRLAEARTGELLPTATLCYVWDGTLPSGTLLPNAYTRRVRIITLGGVAQRWQAEQRDLAADFLRAFGDEAATVPPLVAIAVGADADNTGSRSLAYLDALVLQPR